MPINVQNHSKVLTATFNKDFIEKVTKENMNNKMGGLQDLMAQR